MKKIFLITTLFLNFGWADPTIFNPEKGYRILRNEKFETFTFNGFLETIRSDFTKLLKVNGSLLANKSRFSELDVNGDVKLHESMLLGPGVIKGKLTADHSVVLAPLEVTAQNIICIRSLIDSITINPTGNSTEPQIIKLSRGSVVQGNIVFESRCGEVHLSRDSRIYGCVIGGTICPFVE